MVLWGHASCDSGYADVVYGVNCFYKIVLYGIIITFITKSFLNQLNNHQQNFYGFIFTGSVSHYRPLTIYMIGSSSVIELFYLKVT